MEKDDLILVPKGVLEQIHSNLEIVRSVELLEYHDRNHLSWDVPRRCRQRIFTLGESIETIERYIK